MTETLPLPPTLTLGRYRIALSPDQRLPLPAFAGALLRGGLGSALKAGTCLRVAGQVCEKHCEAPDVCPYAYLFEGRPPANREVLRTTKEIPLPYVLEPVDDGREAVAAGERLAFHLWLFGDASRYFPYLLAAFRRWTAEGVSRARIPSRLVEACAIGPDGAERHLWDAATGRMTGSQPPPSPVAAWLGPMPGADADLTLRFLTPTRLRLNHRIVSGSPPFHAVLRALLRRLSSLSYFYGGQRWEIDYRGWIEAAEQAATVRSTVQWVDWERYSSRQRQGMNLGGIVGEVTYRGDLTPFLPVLRLGELVHVGKAAVFGNGRYEVVGRSLPTDEG